MKPYNDISALHKSGIAGNRNVHLLLLFVLGLTSIMAQVLILREFLMSFGGNEFIIGVFLAAWMLFTAIGAFAGRKYTSIVPKTDRILAALYLMGYLPFVLLCLTGFLRGRIFMPGIQPGIVEIVVSAVLIVSPFCTASGFLFTRLSVLVRSSRENRSFDESYAAESLGSMTGGILFSFLLVFIFDNVEAACFTAVISSCAVACAAGKKVPLPARVLSFVIPLGFATYVVASSGSLYIRQQLYPGQQIVEMHDTRYGNLAVTRLEDQLNFYQNNVLLFATNDRLSREEAVHYGLVQHQGPEEVLLISGGIAGLATEVLKYPTVRQIDCVEPDPKVFVLGSTWTSSQSGGKVVPHAMDARKFVKGSRKIYDAVIIDLPEPSSLELNRYFTVEFFREVKDILSADGILTFSLPSTSNYMNEAAVRLHSSIYNTCKAVFSHVNIYPAGRNIFVASDAVLDCGITALIEKRGIPTEFVNLYYVDDLLAGQRAGDLMERLDTEERINADFKPTALYGFMSYWMSLYNSSLKTFLIFMAGFFLAVYSWLLTRHPVYPGMFSAGFTASSLQVILLLAFQVVMGHIYQSLGLFIAIFMAGLALGALARTRLMPACTFALYANWQLLLVCVACLIPLLIYSSRSISGQSVLVHLLFGGMILSVSFITGVIFSASLLLSGSRHDSKSASVPAERLPGVYAADMAGAALGAILTVLFLIPLAGILQTSFACAVLVLISAAAVYLKQRLRKAVT